MAPEAAGFVGWAKAKVAAARRKNATFDHLVLMVEHYGKVQGSVLAGAVTYFGFLSFFPILALAFSVVGFVSVAYPDARDSLSTAIQQVFPGIITETPEPGKISIEQIEDAKGAAGVIGFLGLLYTGLGWLSGMRGALTAAFEIPPKEKRNFVVGKLVDLMVLATIGLVMILSVGIAGTARGLADNILETVGLDALLGRIVLWLLGVLLGLVASTFLFFVIYRLLGSPDLPTSALWRGAILGAIGFEILKWLVVNVLGGVGGSAFAPLAIAITLVVWINYFSRLVMAGASWAMTSPLASDALQRRPELAGFWLPDGRQRWVVAGTGGAGLEGLATLPDDGERDRRTFDPGSAIMGAAAAVAAAAFFWRRD